MIDSRTERHSPSRDTNQNAETIAPSPVAAEGGHLLVGWLAALAFGLLFAALGTTVSAGVVLPIDLAGAGALRAVASPGLTDLMRLLTHAGDAIVVLVVSIVAVAWLVRRRRSAAGLILAVATVGMFGLEVGLKLAFGRARPDVTLTLATADGFSYPSGHAVHVVVVYGFLLGLVLLARPRWWLRLVSAVALGGLIVSVSLSRVYLGVHYPTDLIGSLLLGLFWVSVCLSVARTVGAVRRRRRQRPSGVGQSGSMLPA